MYARKTGGGRLIFVVENHKGYAEIILRDSNGIIEEAYYSDRRDYKADFFHKKEVVLNKMAEISVACFTEMFEHLSKAEPDYIDAKRILRRERDALNRKIINQLELQGKMNKLLE